MPVAISPETLPGWPYKEKDFASEEVTLLACLLGWYGDKEHPLTGVFGQVVAYWEGLRHDAVLVELLTRQRSVPANDDWRDDPVYTTLFAAPHGFIVQRPEFPSTPFLSLPLASQSELLELFSPGQPALEVADIELLDAGGILEQFQQLAKLAQEKRLHKRTGERFKQGAILRDKSSAPGESIYYPTFKVRAHQGSAAVLEAFKKWLKDNAKLFPKVGSISRRQWEDPRPILSDLAILRLVKLYGYDEARKWTVEHRPKELKKPPLKATYQRYFVERQDPQGPLPIYRDHAQYVNAVRRALKSISEVSHLHSRRPPAAM
jgi:hypothetical protein